MGEIFRIPKATSSLPFSGERYTSAALGDIELEHLHRYFLARKFCAGKDVLDVASGEGYGSAILAQVARSVVGVDLCAAALGHASSNYAQGNINFVVGDASYLPLCDASFDIVVSFETLEHCNEGERFLREIVRVLRPDGILFISTPDREVYSPVGRPANPYHVREYSREEFKGLIGRHFASMELYTQRCMAGSTIVPTAKPSSATTMPIFERRGEEHAELDFELPRSPYLMALASSSALPVAFSASVYVDPDREANGLRTGPPADQITLQIFPHRLNGYSESSSIRTSIPRGEWTHISVPLPSSWLDGPLRVDPSDSVSVIQVCWIRIVDGGNSEVVWEFSDASEFRTIQLAGSACLLSTSDGLYIFSYGRDAQILLPELRIETQSAKLEIKLKVDEDLTYVADLLRTSAALSCATKEGEKEGARTEVNGHYESEVATLRTKMEISFPSHTVIQIFPFVGGGYSEQNSFKQIVPVDCWNTVTFLLPEEASNGPIRLDPSLFPSIIEIVSVEIIDRDSGQTLWSLKKAPEDMQLQVAGSTWQLSGGPILVFFSYGFDAQIMLPAIENRAGALRVDVLLRVEPNLDRIHQRLLDLHREKHDLEAEAANRYESDLTTLRRELEASYNERLALIAEIKQLATKRHSAEREQQETADAYRKLSRANEVIGNELELILGPELYASALAKSGHPVAATYNNELRSIRERNGLLESELEACRNTLAKVMHSKSWKLTESFRSASRFIRAQLRS